MIATHNATTGGLETYRQDAGRTFAGRIEFKEKLLPRNAWTPPLVTGHKYKFSFGNTGVDFEELDIELSERWEESDKPIYLVHNFTDVRAKFDVKVGSSNPTYFFNNSIASFNLANTTANF